MAAQPWQRKPWGQQLHHQQQQHQQQQQQDTAWAGEGDAEQWPGDDGGNSFEADSAPRPPAHAPPMSVKLGWQRQGTPVTPVKQELGTAPHAGETDRQAKIRLKMEKIRREAKGEVPADVPLKATIAQKPPPEPRQPDKVPMPQVQEQTGIKRKDPPNTVDESRREAHDATKLEGMLPPLEVRITAAEEEAERVAILAAPLAMEPTPELKDLQLTAVRETERAAKAATASVAAARRELEARKREAQAFAPMAQESANAELGKLLDRLNAAQANLDEHKSVRKDHELAIATEKTFGELSQRLAGVEIDCEKAAMMAEPLSKALDDNPQDISASAIRETKEALRVAQATLAPTLRLISGKIGGLKGATRTKMLDLQSRAEVAQGLLDSAQKTALEAQSRAASAPMVQLALERLGRIEEVLNEMRETEGPFLMGIETIPGEEGIEVLGRMDRAAAKAHSEIADAHKFVSLKIVEVGRLAEGAATAARAEMQKVKEQLDESMERVSQFQAETAKRRRANLIEVVRGRVEDAEASVQKLKEAGAALQCAAAGDELRDALEKGHTVEVEAQNAVTSARRELQDRQQELRPLEGNQADALKHSSEILRTKVRVNYMEAELTKYKKIAKECEDKIQVEKSLAEISDGLREAEEEAEHLIDASDSWPSDSKPPAEDEAKITAVQGRLSSTTMKVEQKLQTAQGLELKELKAIFGRLKAAQGKLERVKDTARNLNKAQSAKHVQEIAEQVQAVEAKVADMSLAASSPSTLPLDQLDEINRTSGDVIKLVADATDALASSQGPGLLLEAKVEFARLQLRCKAAQRKAMAAADAVAGHFDRVSMEATDLLLDALRTAAKADDGTTDANALFLDLSDGGAEVSVHQVVDHFARHQPDLPDDKLKFAFNRLAPFGLSKRGFAGLLADFMKASRDVTITDSFEIQTAKKVRKLEMGELVEMLGATQDDAGLGLTRAQCRAVRDGARGWVTVKSGTAGASYLERASRSMLWSKTGIPLRSGSEAESSLIRDLLPGEVMELVEGPRQERLGSDKRVRGMACHEDSSGWLQVSDKAGKVLAKLNADMYKCTEAIAMTDVADFEKCEMLRRIDAGEALILFPDEAVTPNEGGTRQRFRACRDGTEGWVTVQGSQGTQYVRAAPRHYVCLQPSPIHVGLGAESAVVRVLMPGEAFAAFEEPKDVSGGDTRTLYRVRASTDGVEGWIASTSKEEVKPWTSRYTVLRAVPLTQSCSTNEASGPVDVVRALEPGEIVEAAEPPVDDRASGQLRVRCLATSDRAVGWATVREGNSASAPLHMQPISLEEEKAAALKARAKSGAADDDASGAAPSTPPIEAGKGKGKGKGSQKGFGKRPVGNARPPSDEPPAKFLKGKSKGKGKSLR